jgi:O-antigen/teichoic acid export membrane protein
MVSIIRFKPFDMSTVEGRSKERLRRVFWTASTSVMAKSANTLSMLIAIPIILNYLGSERFGLYMAISSIIIFLGFADLGIGNVVLNLISESKGKNDVEGAKKNVSSAFFMLVYVAIGLTFIFFIIYPHARWAQFFNASSEVAKQEVGPAVIIFVICYLLNVPISIIPRIQMGYQEGYLSSIWQAISHLIGLGGIFAIIYLKGGLPWLVLSFASVPIIGNLLNGIGLFVFQRSWLIPRWKCVSTLISKKIISIGFLFLILQVTYAIVYFVDNIIIAKVLGPEAVTNYAVPVRLFMIVPTILHIILGPLWPAYGEAYAQGDIQWMKTTVMKAILITSAGCAFASVLLISFGEKILLIWVGNDVIFSLPLMVSLSLWMTLSSVTTAMAIFLNAINKIRFRAIFSLFMAFFSTLAKIVLVGRIGLQGIVWANIMACILFMLIPYAIYIAQLFANQFRGYIFRARNI